MQTLLPKAICSEVQTPVMNQPVWEEWDISLAKVVSAGRLWTNGPSNRQPFRTAKPTAKCVTSQPKRLLLCSLSASFPGVTPRIPWEGQLNHADTGTRVPAGVPVGRLWGWGPGLDMYTPYHREGTVHKETEDWHNASSWCTPLKKRIKLFCFHMWK